MKLWNCIPKLQLNLLSPHQEIKKQRYIPFITDILQLQIHTPSSRTSCRISAGTCHFKIQNKTYGFFVCFICLFVCLFSVRFYLGTSWLICLSLLGNICFCPEAASWEDVIVWKGCDQEDPEHGTMCQPGSKGRKVILSSDRENKTEMSSICLPVSFTLTRVPKEHVSHLYLTRVSPNYINICIYFKKNPTFKTITDFFRKANISAINIFKTHKQANAYPLCTTTYPAAQNDGQSWTEFPFPQPLPTASAMYRGRHHPCKAGLEQESWVLPCSRHSPGCPGPCFPLQRLHRSLQCFSSSSTEVSVIQSSRRAMLSQEHLTGPLVPCWKSSPGGFLNFHAVCL